MIKKNLLLHLFCSCFILTICITSCSYKQNQVLFENSDLIKKQGALNSADDTTKNYKIRPGDVLQVRNLQNLSLITNGAATGDNGSSQSATAGLTYEVDENGKVALPVIGHIKIVGLSKAETSDYIESLYRKNLLNNPIIQIEVINLKVTMLGEVKSPGNYPLTKDKTTLVEMIGAAGGLTEKANEQVIKIVRGGPANPVVIEINLRDVSSISNPQAALQNRDIVYVSQNKRAIKNDKLQSFSLLIQPVLLLLNTALIIYTLRK